MSESISPALAHTANIVSAFAGHNTVASEELPGVIRIVFRTLTELDKAPASVAAPTKPAVSAARSVFNTHILCMECGKKMKMLKRHLMNRHGLTTDQYRTKYDLPRNYPMVAPDHAARRSKIAKEMGLGKNKVPKGARRQSRR